MSIQVFNHWNVVITGAFVIRVQLFKVLRTEMKQIWYVILILPASGKVPDFVIWLREVHEV